MRGLISNGGTRVSLSFARHVVAGEDARVPDSPLLFSPETHDLRTPLSRADYNRMVDMTNRPFFALIKK
jgi:hypothetical protein